MVLLLAARVRKIASPIAVMHAGHLQAPCPAALQSVFAAGFPAKTPFPVCIV